MASFSQWRKAGSPVRRITWVCGPEPVLAAEVIGAQLAAVPPLGVVRMHAGESRERDIWDACALPGGDDRLVLVSAAERLRDPARIIALAGSARTVARAVFASAGDDLARGPDGLAAHLAAIRDCRYAQMIRCTAPEGDALLDWAAAQWPGLGRNAAWKLVTRARGNLAAIRDAGARARAAGYEDARYIDALCDVPPGEELAEHLAAGDKPAAFAAAAALPPSDMGGVLLLLSSRLSVLAAIRDGQQRHLRARELCMRTGVPQFLLARYRDAAGSYTPARVRRCRQLLAVADAAWRCGAEGGVAETVIANW